MTQKGPSSAGCVAQEDNERLKAIGVIKEVLQWPLYRKVKNTTDGSMSRSLTCSQVLNLQSGSF